mgnify:CR=1 FL=1
MTALAQTYWPVLVAALAIGLIVAWYLFHATRRTRVGGTARDVLDEGAAPAARNAALIEAPPAAKATPAAAPPDTPVSAAAPAPAPVPGGASELARIKGVGPKLVARLGELGVTSLAQVAAWDDAEIERIDGELGRFAGRIRQDDWVGQARLLSAGNGADYASRYGAADPGTS